MTTVLASSALCPPGDPSPGWIALDGGRIVDLARGRAPRGAVDLGDALLAPGFVDLQCNGIDDVDFASADADGWRRGRASLARHGVTSFAPTFVSAPLDAYEGPLAAAAAERSSTGPGAQVLGVHLEGPFLGNAPGAHDTNALRPVDLAWLEHVLTAYPDVVRIVTLAPEADPDLRGTRALAARGVVVAIGHSTATYDDAARAAKAGASVVTHVFNGMGSLHHRAPGLAGAALADDRLTPTLVADLVHVHPAVLRIVLTCKRDTVVVSDSVGVRDGVRARDGAAWSAAGTLAGATSQLDAAVANLVASGIDVASAIRAVTASPARLLGATDYGTLCVGARADVVALDPRHLGVLGVWLADTGAMS